jgi:hypothetical protein
VADVLFPTHQSKCAEEVDIVVFLPLVNRGVFEACHGRQHAMVDHDPVDPVEREDGEFYRSQCCLGKVRTQAFCVLVDGRWHQVLGITHIFGRHISRKACDLGRIAFLELLEGLGRSGDQDDVVGRIQQGLGHGETNAAACAGNNDCLFHLLTGMPNDIGC